MSHFRRLLPLLGARWPTLVSPGVLSPLASFSRAQVGSLSSAVLADGATRVEFGADVRRFNGAARRLLIEGQRINGLRNPRCEGATAGVLGSGGAMPTNWTLAVAGGVTIEVVGVVTSGGVQCLRLAITGTATAGANLSLVLEGATVIAATVGQAWTGSAFLARDPGGGATPNIQLRFLEHNSAGTQLVASPGANETVSASLSRVSRVYTTTQATCAFIRSFLTIGVLNGSTYNTTLDVGWQQLELGAFASTPILPPVGTPGASTRGADLVAAPLAGLGISDNGACTIVGTFMLPQMAPASAQQVLVQIDGGSETQRIFLRNGAGANSLVLGKVGGGSTTIAVGSLSAGQVFRCGFTVDGAGRVVASLNGAAPVEVTGALTSGFTTLRLGDSAAAVASMFGEVGTVLILPRPVSDAELQARVAALPL
ncbi:MAG: hypothetical protein K2X46_17370 [Roseomonas sp.]|nr:hypothetical protein [Roseomonas sp.]